MIFPFTLLEIVASSSPNSVPTTSTVRCTESVRARATSTGTACGPFTSAFAVDRLHPPGASANGTAAIADNRRQTAALRPCGRKAPQILPNGERLVFITLAGFSQIDLT